MSEKRNAERLFVVDNMLGKVAKWLRLLGFDVIYMRLSHKKHIDDHRKAGRILITRNRRWCGQSQVVCVDANDPMEQLQEVIAKVPIAPQEARLLYRCTVCNEPLQSITRSEASARVPDYVLETSAHFRRCPKCLRIYWPGSHPKRVSQRLQEVLGWSL